VPAWLRRILGVPLAWKLAGANVLIGLAAASVVAVMHEAGAGTSRLAEVLVVTLVLTLVVNVLVVRTALRPLLALEATAGRVWRGDFTARVPGSLLADRDMARVGNTLNLLLDAIERDRAHLRRLATQIIQAQDEERSRLARELHDSVAQTIAALVLQISAVRRDYDEGPLAERLDLVRAIAGEALEEVRLLSHTVHPRVLDDLGLPAALEWLARQTREAEGLQIEVVADEVPDELPLVQSSALYRVAQEALRNAVRHAGASQVLLRLTRSPGTLSLEVADDGAGFDVAAAEARRPGMGLFAMRERVALVDGSMEILSRPGSGTRIRASVPLSGGDHP
jgi:signal transduction histidine kinase